MNTSLNVPARLPLSLLVIFCLMTGSATVAFAQEDPAEDYAMPAIELINGPATGAIGDMAQIAVPPGFVFTGADGTQQLMTLMQNPIDGTELALLAPESSDDETEDDSWFIVFQFEDIGYVKDDEKDEIDADALLASFREGTERANEERRARGWPTMEILGWAQEPRYNEATNHLEWAIEGASEGYPVINYNTRRLGRHGVMSALLVCDPEDLAATLPVFNDLMDGFQYTTGNRYAEFREGDRIAQYGLTALIAGGAVAAAAKSGLFKWLWKLLVAAAVGAAALFKRLLGRKSGQAGDGPAQANA